MVKSAIGLSVALLLPLLAGRATDLRLGHDHRASQGASLEAEIASADRALFDAFNARDITGVMVYFAKDLEFYHDNDGKLSYDDVRAGFTKMFSTPLAPQRTLVNGSMHVYPVPNYGAMQVGEHLFCHIEQGKPDCGVFQFAHVWQNVDGRWRITRAMSYGH